MTEALLPVPPSTNALFFNAKSGRVKTHEYKSWIKSAGLILNSYRLKAPSGPLGVSIRVGRVNEARDLDNFIKPLCDLLVKCGVIPDDNLKLIHSVMAFKDFDDVPAGYIGLSVVRASSVTLEEK